MAHVQLGPAVVFKKRMSAPKWFWHIASARVHVQTAHISMFFGSSTWRSSSPKLRALTKKIAALLMTGRTMLVLAYTHTSVNPADKPSRVCLKRKWSNV